MAKPTWTERMSGLFSKTKGTSAGQSQGIDSAEQASQPSDLAKPPEWYSMFATNCMEQAQKITSGNVSTLKVKIYEQQCLYLADKLESAVDDSQKSYTSSPPEHKARCLEISKLLYWLAKEVESFIQDCCKDEWVKVLIALTDVPLRVSSIGYHLELCTVLLRNSNKFGAAKSTWTELEGLKEAELHEDIKKIASTDEGTLLSKLESLIQSSNSSSAECQLATICLERLKPIHAISITDTLKSSKLGFWKIDDESLKRGKTLGQGTSGTVLEASWLGVVQVAEKVFYGPSTPNFEREMSFLMRLSHPNIVSFLGYRVDERSCSTVMELMDGSLNLLMRKKLQHNTYRKAPFSIFVGCDIMLQVAEGVRYIHQKSVVHRDLKSSNILVKRIGDKDDEFVTVKVADFGLSKMIEQSKLFSYQTSNIGTTFWRAPEVLHYSHNDHQDTRSLVQEHYQVFKSDVYSFAMLCYEILTGDVPFSTIRQGHSGFEVTKMVLAGLRTELPDQCPPNLMRLINLCWDRDPIKRPSFAEICKELRDLKCSLLIEPLDQVQMSESTQVIPSFNIQGLSNFKEEYSNLKVEKQLKEGGSDTVVLYLSTWLQNEVVQQVAQKTFVGSHDECFMNEVSIMAGLKHPNIVRMLCYATDWHSCSILMELMDGDLYDLMQMRLEWDRTRTFPFSMTEAAGTMLQIARGMHYLHQENIAHRDLKSTNILVKRATKKWLILGSHLDFKVADFGKFVKMTQSCTNSNHSLDVGTVRWMAPEAMSLRWMAPEAMSLNEDDNQAGTSNYDLFKSDIYSFAMVCYEILTGKLPFSDITPIEVKKKVLADKTYRPILPYYCSCNLKSLIEKCWQWEASARPSFLEIIEGLKLECLPNPKAFIGRFCH